MIEEVEMCEPIYDEASILVNCGESLVVRRSLHTKTSKEEPWQRHNIFHTSYTSQRKDCDVMIYSGSCENVVSNYMVEKLKLPQRSTHVHTSYNGSTKATRSESLSVALYLSPLGKSTKTMYGVMSSIWMLVTSFLDKMIVMTYMTAVPTLTPL